MKISIEGKELVLVKLAKTEIMRNVKIPDVWIHFAIYHTQYLGIDMLVLEQIVPNTFTPLRLKYIADEVSRVYNMPTVFYFEKMDFYQRQRFIERGIYFLISNKYAYIPMLLINAKMAEHKVIKQLSAVAQWLLLYHLQIAKLDSKTARELVQETPYQYTTLTRAIRVLEELRLCEIDTDANRYKHLYFIADKKALWEAARPYLINPIEQVWYCDHLLANITFPKAGISALSHYSMLNDEEIQTYALIETQMKEVRNITTLNPIEGIYRLEQWTYPPIIIDGYVDKLSLALAMQDDHDPRVEKEVKQLVEIIC